MDKELLINASEGEVRIALLENGTVQELFIEREQIRGTVGNIYKGRVENVLPGMQAAFVNIGLERNGYLFIADVADHIHAIEEILGEEEDLGEPVERRGEYKAIDELLKPGQEILVQVRKEATESKGARLSSYICLPGRFLVLMPTVEHIGISRRITDERERERLRNILKKLKPPGVGFIVRTAGEGKGAREFAADIKYLMNLWKTIQRRTRRLQAPALVYEELGLVYRVLRDMLTPDISRIIIDSKEEYSKVKKFLKVLAPDIKLDVVLYQDTQPLFEKYDVEREIEQALQERVWLKSGGYIVINQTEALVAIDVNTGKYIGKTDLENTVLRTNLEAAVEIARQLRLRDLSGIILIDFIDMQKEANRKRVLRKLSEELHKDRAKTYILEITKLGLVEMTRQRMRHSLSDIVCEVCPYCHGRGLVKSGLSMALSAYRKLRRICSTVPDHTIIIRSHPEVAQAMREENLKHIKAIERRYRKRIVVEEDDGLHIEDIRFVSGDNGREIFVY